MKFLQAITKDGERLTAPASSRAEANRQLVIWMTVGYRVDSAEHINEDGEVVAFYERGRWQS